MKLISFDQLVYLIELYHYIKTQNSQIIFDYSVNTCTCNKYLNDIINIFKILW